MNIKKKLIIIFIIFAFFICLNNISNASLEETGDTFSVIFQGNEYIVPYVIDPLQPYYFYWYNGDSSSAVYLYTSEQPFQTAFRSGYAFSFYYTGKTSRYTFWVDLDSFWSETVLGSTSTSKGYALNVKYYSSDADYDSVYYNNGIGVLYSENGETEFGYGVKAVYDTLDEFLNASKPSYDKDITLFIDDMNFRKRFSFQFHIPMENENTKYFCFLDNYTRNSYNSVTGEFVIYTVDTPEGYDYTYYENYLYYDNLDKKFYLPAGCIIKKYSCIANNGDLYSLNLEEVYSSVRNPFIIYDVNFCYELLNANSLFLEYGFDNLFPTDLFIDNLNYESWFDRVLSVLKFSVDGVKVNLNIADIVKYFVYGDFNELLYYSILKIFYYDSNYLDYDFNDFCFGNTSIVSYENEKYSNEKTANFYNLYRKTKVYNMENQINDTMFALTYSDKEDVSSMLPDGLTVEYLTSPFFQDNENSSSGGYITYYINEIIYGDKEINYSQEESPIREKLPFTYIENFEEGDNIIINNITNPNIETIDNTSDENGILQRIYWSVYNIEMKLDKFGDTTTNNITNITNNTQNFFNKYFIPQKYKLKETADELNDTASEHLGIVYEPLSFLIYTVTLFSEMDNTTEIKIDIPKIEYKEVQLIPQITFSFTSYMQDLPILYQIHQIYLTAVDFIILGLLIAYACKVHKEVFDK